MRDNVALFVVIGHLHGQRAIDEQHIAAIDEGHAQGLAEQQGPESGSIDKKVAAQPARLAGFHIVDVTPVVFDDRGYFIDDVTYAEFLDAMIANKRREPASVQMIG